MSETEAEFILVDVLPEDAFAKEHLPNAINIPLEKLSSEAKLRLNKNQRIVVYGDTHESERSNKAAEILEDLGYRKVSDFDGGIHAWKRAGFLTVVNED